MTIPEVPLKIRNDAYLAAYSAYGVAFPWRSGSAEDWVAGREEYARRAAVRAEAEAWRERKARR